MKKYAVIGNPIGHSLSPIMHNAAFKELGVDAHYEALEVEHLERSYNHLKKTYSGINITIPHKVAIMDLIDEMEMMADLVGALNCVDFRESAKGFNTDIIGAIDALKTQVPKLENKKILVLGAGGAARAVVYGCALERAKVTLHNRTKEKAQNLADHVKEGMNANVNIVDEYDLNDFDILVNTTSVGMFPEVDACPIDCEIPKKLVVMDIVYNPLETELLKRAKAAGAKTIAGVEMFLGQGAESLRIWGYNPPVEVMRKAVLEELR
jgi:shikimate dehydrogenase